jgi:predicted dehydrogenase
VLCEKPLATTNEDARAMIAAAAAAGVTLATAFPLRHNLPARAVKRTLDEGVIGEVLAVRATNRGQVPPGWFLDPALAGGGAVLDHTVHVLDLLRWCLQDEPVEVYAEISHGLHGLPVEDAAFLTVTFASGMVATLDPSWSRPTSFPTWGDLTMEIAGAKGTINLDAEAQKIMHYPAQSAGTEWLPWGNDDNRALIADFVAAVREGRPAAATGHDGARALAVALAAYESAALERPVVVSA